MRRPHDVQKCADLNCRHVDHVINGRFEMGAVQVDQLLWEGAYAEGWRIRESFAGCVMVGDNSKPVIVTNEPWTYVAPQEVARYKTRAEAEAHHERSLRGVLAADALLVRARFLPNDPSALVPSASASSSSKARKGPKGSWSASVAWSPAIRKTQGFSDGGRPFGQGPRGRARLQVAMGKHREGDDATFVSPLPPQRIRVVAAIPGGPEAGVEPVLKSACVTVVDALGVSFTRSYRRASGWLQWADLPLSFMCAAPRLEPAPSASSVPRR